MSIQAYEDSELPALLAAALEMRDQGVDPPLEEICRERPDLIGALRKALEFSQQLPDLQRVSAARDRLAGRTLGSRYRLDSRLGSGAMGVVYKGHDLELDRTVAIKILRLPMGDEDAAEVRFAREAEALAALRHPNVVTIHDRGRTGDDDPFLVMEFVEGLSLSGLLVEIEGIPGGTSSKDTQPIAVALGVESIGEPSYLRAIVRWMAELANGLALAHRKGILHRDIKPSNILLRRNAEPVLLDFGIAAQTSQETITRDGSLVGTPAFMAPEVLEQGTEPSPALDIYGLTATLYQMLTLRPPYAGTPTQVLSALGRTDPTPAGRLGEGLPADLLAILDRGMARRPSDRYQTMSELEADLRAFLDYRPVKARPLSPLTRAWRRVRRSAAWRAGATVAAVAIALVLTVQVRSAWRAERQVALREVWRHVPPNLGIAGPATRRLTLEEGRLEIQEMLDEAVALSDELLPATLVRAMFRFDHGQLADAATDMERIGAAVGTPYARALARRYRERAATEGTEDVETSGLPEPTGSMDRYLAAVHALRESKLSEAKTWLEDPGLSEFVPAQELSTLLMGDRTRQLERGIWLEERIGCRTANTASLIGLAQLLKQDYRAAYEALEEGLELAPHSHPLQLNAARAAWMLDRREDAREHYRQVITLRPDNVQGHELYIRFLTDTGWTAEAQAALDAAPFGDQAGQLALRRELQGSIETELALAHRSLDAAAESLAAALRAEEEFAQARSLGREVDTFYSHISSGIANDDPDPVFMALIESLEEQPLNSRRFQLLEQLMPDDLDETQVAHLRRLLASIREAFVSRGLSEASD